MAKDSAESPDSLVADPQVAKELGCTLMTLWRWDQDPNLDFPPRIKIRKRNFRSRSCRSSSGRPPSQTRVPHVRRGSSIASSKRADDRGDCCLAQRQP